MRHDKSNSNTHQRTAKVVETQQMSLPPFLPQI